MDTNPFIPYLVVYRPLVGKAKDTVSQKPPQFKKSPAFVAK